MLPKIITSIDIPFILTPHIQVKILYCYTTKTDILLQNIRLSYYHRGTIQITSNNIMLHYNSGGGCLLRGLNNDNKIILTCASNWVQMMRALNNISLKTKRIISWILEIYPKRLMMIIDVIMSIQDCDVVLILLEIMFDQTYFDQTYAVYTYVNNNDNLEMILCYS